MSQLVMVSVRKDLANRSIIRSFVKHDSGFAYYRKGELEYVCSNLEAFETLVKLIQADYQIVEVKKHA
jgi:hypothetical protein